MAGAVLMLPPVDTGDAAVVAEEVGILESSLRRCSLSKGIRSETQAPLAPLTVLRAPTQIAWLCCAERVLRQMAVALRNDTHLKSFQASLLLFQGSLLFPLVHFGEGYARVGQRGDRIGQGAGSAGVGQEDTRRVQRGWPSQYSKHGTHTHTNTHTHSWPCYACAP